MNRDSKREIQGKRSKSYLLRLLISPRRPIEDLLQEEEEEELAEGEEEAADEADLPRMIKRKKSDGELFLYMNTRVLREPSSSSLSTNLRNYPLLKWMKKTSLNK